MVTINLGRKEAVFFATVLIIFLAVGFGVSLNSGNYLIHGHDSGEIGGLISEILPTCLTGQVLKVNSTGQWVCGPDVSSAGSTGVPMPSCAEGQILKADSSGGFSCSEDDFGYTYVHDFSIQEVTSTRVADEDLFFVPTAGIWEFDFQVEVGVGGNIGSGQDFVSLGYRREIGSSVAWSSNSKLRGTISLIEDDKVRTERLYSGFSCDATLCSMGGVDLNWVNENRFTVRVKGILDYGDSTPHEFGLVWSDGSNSYDLTVYGGLLKYRKIG